MHVVIFNDNETPIYWGTKLECNTYLIMKARTIASTDQKQYEQYIHDITEDGELNTVNPKRNFKIKEIDGN